MNKKINVYDTSSNDMYKLLMESDEFVLYIANALLKPKVKFSFLTRPNPTLYEGDSKEIEIDSLVYLDGEMPLVIEMQGYKKPWLITRLGIYECRIASIGINSGKNSYQEYKKPFLISFCTFNIFNDYYYVHKVSDRKVKTIDFKGKKPKKKVTKHNVYFNNSSVVDTYIVEVNKIPDNDDYNDLCKVCKFFQIKNEEDFNMFKEANPDFVGTKELEAWRDRFTLGMVQAMKDIARLDARQEYLDGEKNGVKKGIKKTARKMLEKGYSMEDVISITNLDEKVVLKMQRKISGKKLKLAS